MRRIEGPLAAEFDKGIELLKKYLKLAPNSPHKREVEDLIITLVE